MEERDPQVLWRRIGAGDRRAFNALYARYEADVVRFCRALLHDGDDAREAANSTWASVWRARAAAERDVELRPWLFRIARNEAIDILRRRRSYEPLDMELAGPADPAAEAELHERFAVLRADLLALTEHQRTALVLRELSGMGHDEIGAALGVSSSAAKQTIYEARRALIEAEGGRSLSCDLVRRDLAGGDKRVLRGRRLRAHLRSCVGCRELAAGVERRGRDLRALLPAPVAALLSRLGPVALGGGATAGVVGAKLTAPLLGKVATAAVAAAVGTSAAAHHPPAPAQQLRAAGVAPAPAARTKPPRPAAPQASSVHQHARRVRAESPAAQGHALARRTAAAASSGTTAPATAARTTSSASVTAATTTVSAAAKAVPAGQAKQGATTSPSASAPGQVKKASDASPSASAPGQVKKTSDASPSASAPGQVKKASDASPSASAPGQVKQQADAPPPATTVAAPAPAAADTLPPGQARQADPPAAATGSDARPPGQARKLGGSPAG